MPLEKHLWGVSGRGWRWIGQVPNQAGGSKGAQFKIERAPGAWGRRNPEDYCDVDDTHQCIC